MNVHTMGGMSGFSIQDLLKMGTEYLYNIPVGLLQFFGKLVMPFNLSVLPTLADTNYFLVAASIILVAAGIYFSRNRKWNYILFGASWFIVLVSNTDDHLRNHGFILTNQGWRLSPAYDMNPYEMGNGLTLNISENSNELDISVVMSTASYYQVKVDTANRILEEMLQEITNWRAIAKKFGISNSEIELTKRAFRLV